VHRLLVVHLNEQWPDKFRVVADSSNPKVSEANPISLELAGGSAWAEFDDSTGYSSPFATIPCRGTVTSLGYWYVKKTGNILKYDFAAAGLSERKVITSGELHVEYEGRTYIARPGDSMIFLVDPEDQVEGKLRPFPVTFRDHPCTVVYTEYLLTSA
jgi:hypothetical protein